MFFRKKKKLFRQSDLEIKERMNNKEKRAFIIISK